MIAIFFIIIGVFARLLPHPANFTPIAAIALFGGKYLDKRLAFILPLVVMVISDSILGFHSTVGYVYGSIFLTSLLGMAIKKTRGATPPVVAALTGSILFFLITNFGVWREGMMYPMTLHGLVESYINALPFFRNTIAGDLFYTVVFFGGYESIYSLYRRKIIYGSITQRR